MRRASGTPNASGPSSRLFVPLGLILALLVATALAGCGNPTVTGSGETSSTPSISSTPSTSSAEETAGGDWLDQLNSVPQDEGSLAAINPKDSKGHTPADVIGAYFAARKSGNLRAAYALVSPNGRPEFAKWASDFVDAAGVVVSYEIAKTRIPRDTSAVVDVTYSSKDPATGAITKHEHEWWEVVRVKGGAWLVPVTSGQ